MTSDNDKFILLSPMLLKSKKNGGNCWNKNFTSYFISLLIKELSPEKNLFSMPCTGKLGN